MSNIPAHSSRSLSAAFARGLPKYFTKHEVNGILYPQHGMQATSDAKRALAYQQRFLCWFLWNTGARIGEALQVRINDIEPYAGVIHLETLKRKKTHIRSLPKTLPFFQEIQAYIHIMGIQNRKDKMFTISSRTAQRWVNDACARAGISKDDERAHPHTFRHSFAVNCIMQGVNIVTLKNWLGHADITKTMIYLQITANDTRGQMHGVEF